MFNSKISEEDEAEIWRAMNFFTDGIAKDLFIASKLEGQRIMLANAIAMEKCYERLFTPRGN